MSKFYSQGQTPYRVNSEPWGTDGFADTRWTPDAELCVLQWLSCLFRSSFQVSDYFEVIGNYDETQLENMKYSGFLFPSGFFFFFFY